MSMRYWLDTSDGAAIPPPDSAPAGLSELSDASSCNARATARASRPAAPSDNRSAVRPVDGLTPPDGQSPHPGPVRSQTTPPRLNPAAFRPVIVRATCYRAEAPGYLALHASIRRHRGPAAARACWRCGRRARVWSCIAAPGDRIRGVSGSGAPAWYSPDPDDYRPACSRCAAVDDREHAEARRAFAHLALSLIPRRERSTASPVPTVPPEPAPLALFTLDPTNSTRWEMP